MIPRRTRDLIEDRLTVYPAVALIGPRQCGKTTLARSLGGSYFDLEQEAEHLRLDLEWDRLLAGSEHVILDEAQAWSEVFPRLRGAIDEDRGRPGTFLLLGSVSPSLMVQVSESLAGRLSLVELTPFLLSELEAVAARRRRWLCGGYPEEGYSLADDSRCGSETTSPSWPSEICPPGGSPPGPRLRTGCSG
jgi:hypothetical protein